MRAIYMNIWGNNILQIYFSKKCFLLWLTAIVKSQVSFCIKKKKIPVTKLGDHTSYELPNNGINVSLENEHLKCSGHFCAFQSHQKKLHGINEM